MKDYGTGTLQSPSKQHQWFQMQDLNPNNQTPLESLLVHL